MARVRGGFTVEVPLEGGGELKVEAGGGDVEVRAGGPGRAVVRGSFEISAFPPTRAERLAELIRRDPPVEVLGREVRVGDLSKYVKILGPGFFGKVLEWVALDYEIEVPRHIEARIRSGSGDIRVADVTGPLVVVAGSGDVELSRIGGDVEVKAGSGDIRVQEVTGELRSSSGSGDVMVHGAGDDVTIHTGSGDVFAAEVRGDLVLRTGSGDVRLEAIGGDAEVSTGSGDIRISSPVGREVVWRLRTGSGDMELLLPPDSRFRLVTESRYGEVHCDLTPDPEAPAAIEAKTGSGNIRIGARYRKEAG